MNNIFFVGMLVGHLTVTSYRSVPSQTDSTPFHTSTNEHVRSGGVAISRDLLCGACRKHHRRCDHPEVKPGKIHYADLVYVEGQGVFRANDCMGNTKWDRASHRHYPIKQAVDLWVASYSEEKAVGVQSRAVYKLTKYDK